MNVIPYFFGLSVTFDITITPSNDAYYNKARMSEISKKSVYTYFKNKNSQEKNNTSYAHNFTHHLCLPSSDHSSSFRDPLQNHSAAFRDPLRDHLQNH